MNQKPINVGIDPTIHRAAKFAALENHLTLKEYVELAIQEKLLPRKLVDPPVEYGTSGISDELDYSCYHAEQEPADE